MERKRAFKMAATCGIAMSLQGCIAAAFPIVAGGLMAGSGRTQSEPETVAAPVAVVEEAASTIPVTQTAPPATGSVEVSAGNATGTLRVAADEASSNLTPADPAAVSVVSAPVVTAPIAAAPAANVRAVRPTTGSVTPVPSPPRPRVAATARTSTSIVVPVPAAPPAVAGATFFDPLFAYASAAEFAGSETRTSAILRNPAMLEPDRAQCNQGVSTILIDLDPEEGELFPVNTRSASPALADRLAQLRLRGVIVAWISKSPVEKSNEIRIALSRSGLDPLGIDEVLLMRSGDERKQSRRDELARGSCLIAIAGDTRADFHELFGYLLNPSDAASLEPLIGEGWFLIPTPLLPERPTR